jgi:DNA invertase Pin-like site-specific DNA recombinase
MSGDFFRFVRVLAMLGIVAKLERRRIKERTARGRADVKAKGIGRQPKLTARQKREAIKRRRATLRPGSMGSFICGRLESPSFELASKGFCRQIRPRRRP